MYFVLGAGGAKYGPADLDTLKQWAAENRITPDMLLEDASTGAQIPARQVPGLFGAPLGSPPPAAPPQDLGAPGMGAPGMGGPMGDPGMAQPQVPQPQVPQPQEPQPGPLQGPAGGYAESQGPYTSPTGQPGPSAPGPYGQPNPYGSNPYGANPYVRPTGGGDPTPFVIAGWVMAPATLFCCLCLSPVGIWCGWKADKEGHAQGKIIMYVNIAALVIGFIVNLVMISTNPMFQQIMRGGGG
jgi:hypothetical protein